MFLLSSIVHSNGVKVLASVCCSLRTQYLVTLDPRSRHGSHGCTRTRPHDTESGVSYCGDARYLLQCPRLGTRIFPFENTTYHSYGRGRRPSSLLKTEEILTGTFSSDLLCVGHVTNVFHVFTSSGYLLTEGC